MSQKLAAPFTIVLLVALGLGCSMLRLKRPPSWSVVLQIDAPAADRETAVKQTVGVLEARLDALGVSGSEVKIQGDPADGRILVNLPNVADRERVKRLITARARLELVYVISPPNPAPAQTYSSREEALTSLGGTVPANRRLLPYAVRAQPTVTDSQPMKWVVVESPAIIDGSDLRSASAVQLSGGEDYHIAFSLQAAGAAKFATWTGANINHYIGVVLNDEVKSIAFIRSQISDQGMIDGRFTKESAEDLALTLRSGALPAPVRIVEEGSAK